MRETEKSAEISNLIPSHAPRYRRDNARIYWPWIPEPGRWAQYDFSDGPVIKGEKTTLFHYYLPYSKYRLVLYIKDQSLPNVMAALHTCFAMTGGVLLRTNR